jgi:transketolase
MRNAFIKFLESQAEIDESIYLISGDLGFSVIETFREKFPHRFINAGIAEQSMIGVAAGLAMTGKRVYVYSIIPFVTMRCFEQIRNDLCYQQLPVTLVGVGGGFSYGALGVTHHAIDDVAIMRALPEMTVVAPGSAYETKHLMPLIHQHNGPTYLRLANNEELVTYPTHTAIQLGKAIEIIPHACQTIIATSNALDLGWQVCHELKRYGIDIGLVSMPTIKPLDKDFFTTHNFDAIFTIEEHSIVGGLGESIAHTLCSLGKHATFHAFGINDVFFHETGNRTQLKERAGLSSKNITATIIEKINHQHTTRYINKKSTV